MIVEFVSASWSWIHLIIVVLVEEIIVQCNHVAAQVPIVLTQSIDSTASASLILALWIWGQSFFFLICQFKLLLVSLTLISLISFEGVDMILGEDLCIPCEFVFWFLFWSVHFIMSDFLTKKKKSNSAVFLLQYRKNLDWENLVIFVLLSVVRSS